MSQRRGHETRPPVNLRTTPEPRGYHDSTAGGCREADGLEGIGAIFADDHTDQPGKSWTLRGRRKRQPLRGRSILAAARAVSGGKATLMRGGGKAVNLTVVVPRRYAKTLGKAVEEFRLKTGITVKAMLVVSEPDVLRRMRAEATSKAGRVEWLRVPGHPRR